MYYVWSTFCNWSEWNTVEYETTVVKGGAVDLLQLPDSRKDNWSLLLIVINSLDLLLPLFK